MVHPCSLAPCYRKGSSERERSPLVQCKQIILSYIGMHAQSQRPFQRGAIGEDTAAADILAGRVVPMSIEGMRCTFRSWSPNVSF
jgi:hypothetical protein